MLAGLTIRPKLFFQILASTLQIEDISVPVLKCGIMSRRNTFSEKFHGQENLQLAYVLISNS
jgi:hypothetical protein